jgi:hypothetical protein
MDRVLHEVVFGKRVLYYVHACRKGKLELIEIKVEQRMGNKKVGLPIAW